MESPSSRVCLVFFNACVMRKNKLQQYREFILDRGHRLVETPGEADLTLVWTCGFRADFRDASLQALERILATTTGRVLITGCLADICPERLPRNPRCQVMPWRDDVSTLEAVFGEGPALTGYDPVFVEEKLCDDTARCRLEHPDADYTFHDQFIKLVISEGCLFNCAYCSEKLAFPPFTSFPKERLVQAVREITARTGVYDIMLLADSLGQYGQDSGETFPGLLTALCAIDPRIGLALNNLNPASLVEHLDFLAGLIRNNRIRHLNLPIQSASDKVLGLMRRTYTRQDLHAVYTLLADLAFTAHDTHLIIGFPGETDEDFQETLDFILEHRPRFVLLSKYMESLGAPSAKLAGKVDAATMRKRLAVAEDVLAKAGIIFNSDDSELGRQRVRSLILNKR